MKTARTHEDRAMHRTTEQERDSRSDETAMSPSMRRLILSFGEADSEPTWNPDAYTRRRPAA
jgi:hypothetical protein